MTAAARTAVGALVLAAALACTALAHAAYTPRLVVNGLGTTTTTRTNATGPSVLSFAQGRDDDATAKATIYVSAGYTALLSESAGTTVGSASATVRLTKDGVDTVTPYVGEIVAEDPGMGVDPADPAACGGVVPHAGVWSARLSSGAETVTIRVFLDPTEGQESDLGAAKLQFCLPAPTDPSALTGAITSAKLLTLKLSLTRFLTNPAVPDEYAFRGFFTPYAAGTATPSAGATVESQALVRIPAQLTLFGKFDRMTRRATLTGSLTERGRPVAGVHVRLLSGRTVATMRPIASLTTSRAGGFKSTTVKLTGTTYYRVQATVPDRPLACGASPTPGGCVSATLSGFTIVNLRTLKVVPGPPLKVKPTGVKAKPKRR